VLEKSIEDMQLRIKDEAEKKEKLLAAMQEDLDEIERMDKSI